MKFRVLHAKNLQFLIGRFHNPDLLHYADRILEPILGGLAKFSGKLDSPLQLSRKTGEPISSIEFLSTPRGFVNKLDHLQATCGFGVNGTQIVLSAFGWTVAMPLNSIIKVAQSVEGKHLVYSHTIGPKEREGEGCKTYVGITKQGLLKRYQQHLADANSGSYYFFHEALRKHMGGFCIHQVLAAGLSKEAAEDYEEMFVEGISLYPKGLNMIPGGRGGLAYLRKLGVLDVSNKSQPRERILSDFVRTHRRESQPNALLSQKWMDDNFAASVICGNPRNLSLEQVAAARILLGGGASPDVVATSVGARNTRIIDRLAAGETYSRVH
jgi:hypothetical protein